MILLGGAKRAIAHHTREARHVIEGALEVNVLFHHGQLELTLATLFGEGEATHGRARFALFHAVGDHLRFCKEMNS